MQRGSGRVLERIPDRVADDRRLVRRTSFSSEVPGLDEFLRVVPSPAARVQYKGHQDARDRSDHERPPEGLSRGDWHTRYVRDLDEAKHEAYDERGGHRQDPGDDHPAEGASRADGHRPPVVRLNV